MKWEKTLALTKTDQTLSKNNNNNKGQNGKKEDIEEIEVDSNVKFKGERSDLNVKQNLDHELGGGSFSILKYLLG